MNFNKNAAYTAAINRFPNHTSRPVIGITGNYGDRGLELGEGYYRSIEAAGGIPIAIPPTDNTPLLLSLLDRIDGLVLSGGADLNPLFVDEDPVRALGNVNPKRDACELLLTRLAYDRQMPIFGICRGIQMMAAALGGTVRQDIYADEEATKNMIKHSQQMPRGVASHFVEANENSLVANLMGQTRFAVNSFHHQAVGLPGDKLCVTARSADGVAECVESTEGKSLLGVQWHPECFILEGDKCQLPLFRWFVEECESFRKAKDVHQQILTLDSHVDTPMFFDRGVYFDHRDPMVRVDMHKMTEGFMDAVVMAAYLKQEGRREDELLAATLRADHLINEITEMVESTKGVQIAYTPKDLFRLKNAGKKAVLIGIENGYAIGNNLQNVERFRRRGVVYMTLCHNGDNDICDSAMKSQGEWGGLSSFGRDVVKEMERTGMMIDLSHAAESTFFDVLSLASGPVVCTHSSSRALCDHPRNLTDQQLQALAANGGVAQATFYPGFLRTQGEEATIDDAVRHIMHMIDVAGIDHVGIGSDFDGDGGVPGLDNEAEMINLTRRLMAEGLNVSHLRRIWGGNFIRVMSQVQYRGMVKADGK